MAMAPEMLVNCFRFDVLYAEVAALAAGVAPLAGPGATTIVFRTRQEFDYALVSGKASVEDAAHISCSLASYPFFVRDTRPWLHALFNPSSVSFLALAIAPGTKEDTEPVIVATASITVPLN